jgi:hypothetical protein
MKRSGNANKKTGTMERLNNTLQLKRLPMQNISSKKLKGEMKKRGQKFE